MENVPSSLIGSELVVSFYDKNNNLLMNNHYDTLNNTAEIIGKYNNYDNEDKEVDILAILHREDFVKVDNCQILIIKDNQIIFNDTKPFFMNLLDGNTYEAISDFDEYG